MNTPAHIIVSIALLNRGPERKRIGPVLAGAIVPDAPMFLFYLWQRGVQAMPDRIIWSDLYFRPDWQHFFDAFNSVPIAAVGLGLSLWWKKKEGALFFGALLLHFATDLPLHHDDGHRHFWPLSELRFESPVSYWDPAHLGFLGAGLEALVVWASAWALWRRYPRVAARTAVAALSLLYALGYLGFYAPLMVSAFTS